MPTAEAHVQTAHATRHLAELCERLDDKARANPGFGVSVAWTETNGTIDFGWGCCALSADAGTLTLRAEAADDEALRQVRELISRHLQRHALDELTLTWRQHGKPIADTRASGRDAMRAFHRGMRH